MQIITDYLNCPALAKNSSIALGNFDGVHKGHQEIIKFAKGAAKKNNTPSAVMTFEPHPVLLFKPETENFRLTKFEKKAKLIEELGIDLLFVINFNRLFSQISADNFIKEILVGGLQVKHVVIGYDYIFGHNRTGNSDLLNKMAKQYQYQFTKVEAVGYETEIYSSTAIRKALRSADLVRAKLMLGRNYTIDGKVEHGDQRGRQIGFPTINVDSANMLLPKSGVYAVKVKLEDKNKNYNAVANIGTKPTFGGEKVGLEVHIFDFSEDIYGVNVEIEFIEYMRAEQKFVSIQLLKNQISADCVKAQEILQ